ncbi:DNA/RNA non-specific endonuclease [Marivirga salinae]|uniref:DNA/RNA non-specific endonuclease n=1 Tax=Marivirga salinarum TaxID=3059078 RepID=A0AA49J9K7_9BACT|nr:DNA/RNA non-specific endonuclease [Marivirga sp. BDSF4-3]WKK77045.2 DNA/RNA non-specific endonuclease [Marivirga sp. BDSF4-3]
MKKILLLLLLLLPFSVLSQENRPEIHCKHFLGGYPYGTPETNDLINRDIYALSNNDDTKFADWVAYRLTPDIINGSKKTRDWEKDPWLEDDETLEPYPGDHGDYDGAFAELKTHRGHQAPLASFDGHPDWQQTNYLSNITPQNGSLNSGVWAKIEKKVRELCEETGEVYVMTGPLYDGESIGTLPGSDEAHKIPTGYWKIVALKEEGDYINAASFIFEQQDAKKTISDALVTIDQIEERSALDFFWMFQSNKETALEANLNKEWALSNFE